MLVYIIITKGDKLKHYLLIFFYFRYSLSNFYFFQFLPFPPKLGLKRKLGLIGYLQHISSFSMIYLIVCQIYDRSSSFWLKYPKGLETYCLRLHLVSKHQKLLPSTDMKSLSCKSHPLVPYYPLSSRSLIPPLRKILVNVTNFKRLPLIYIIQKEEIGKSCPLAA